MPTKRVQSVDPKTFLASVGAGRTAVKYERGQPIFRQGDAADAVFYIQKGKAQITVVSEQGKEGVIGMLNAGEFLGEGCLAGQPLHLASASTTAESSIVRIEKEAMIRALRDEPTFSQLFMAYLLSRNVQIEADLVDQLFNSSEKRLARVLLLLAHFGKDGKLDLVIPHINQIVALIDVLIVLLIFLMVTTTFKQQPALKLVLPESTQAQKSGANENPPLIVSIDPQGNLRFGSEGEGLPVTIDSLKGELVAAVQKNPDIRVALRADTKAPFGQIVKVMDAAKEAKIKMVNAFMKEAAKP